MRFWDQHKTITRYYEILMSSVCEKYQLKHLEYDILMFLHNNPQYRTAADIVRVRKSTKSHVSTSLKTLEDRGFIAKKTDPVNKKHIELDLLEPANEIVRDGLLAQRQFTEQMLRGLTPEEIAQVEIATDTPESLQRETADGLTLEGMLGTDAPEEGMVERIALRESIDQLPEKERMTILLRYFKGLTQEQTARILGVSQVQVSRLERRGLKRLREFLSL